VDGGVGAPEGGHVEQMVEVTLGLKAAFKKGNVGRITRQVPSDYVMPFAPRRRAGRKRKAEEPKPPKKRRTSSAARFLRLAQELKGHGLESFVGHLLEIMGYRARVSPGGPDGGVDILAHEDELGFKPPMIKVQVKATEGNIGDPVVSALYGKVGEGEFGLLVNLGRFTKQAEQFARSKSNLRLIDGTELVSLILQHYEHLDSRYMSRGGQNRPGGGG